MINNQIQLFDELELLRSENYQLRLRVYNAEQRLDRLLSAAAFGRDRNTSNGTDIDSNSTDTDSNNTDTDSNSTDTDSADADASCNEYAESVISQNNAAPEATAKVVVRTIHDLNRRLTALMAATVSAKSVTPLKTVIEEDDEGVGSELTCLRGDCKPLRSVQQLIKTELWARNRMFGKLKQQRCMAQGADASGDRAWSGMGQDNAAPEATAEAAVRTIHDLLTLNRRLLALIAATVSDKSVSVSDDNKRRWRELRSYIEKYAVNDTNKKKTNENKDYGDDNEDEFYDTSAMVFKTFCKAQILSTKRSVTRQNVLQSPLRPPPSTLLQTVSKEDEGVESDVTFLQGQCRPFRSVQQMMKTELWAQNQKYFGKLEQKWFMTQLAYAGVPRERRSPGQVLRAAIAVLPQRQGLQEFWSEAAMSTAMSPPPTTKRVLAIQSGEETPCTSKAPEVASTESQTAAALSLLMVSTTTKTPPPVRPDNWEVDFFFSCDEEDEDGDDYGHREDFAEIKRTSSSDDETANWNDCRSDIEPERLAAVGALVATPMITQKHCRPHYRQPYQPINGGDDSATVTMMTSSSTESAAVENEANESKGDGVIMTKTTATSSCTVGRNRSVGSCLIKRQRGMLPRRYFSGRVDEAAENHPGQPSVIDAQVQCSDGILVLVDHVCSCSDRREGELQLLQLRRELESQRRENGRLNYMLLRLQREMRLGDQGKDDCGPTVSVPDSDLSGSPEPYRRAAEAVHGRIAKLLPPRLSVQPMSDDAVDGGDGIRQRYRSYVVEQQMQRQLTHLRERIVVYKRQELDGVHDDRAGEVLQQSGQQWPEDPLNDVIRRMDHTDLVNVGLPLIVGRLGRALVLMQKRP